MKRLNKIKSNETKNKERQRIKFLLFVSQKSERWGSQFKTSKINWKCNTPWQYKYKMLKTETLHLALDWLPKTKKYLYVLIIELLNQYWIKYKFGSIPSVWNNSIHQYCLAMFAQVPPHQNWVINISSCGTLDSFIKLPQGNTCILQIGLERKYSR